jgi:hypothetical protein
VPVAKRSPQGWENERTRLRERQARRRAEDPRREYLKRQIRANAQKNRRDQEVLDGYTETEG